MVIYHSLLFYSVWVRLFVAKWHGPTRRSSGTRPEAGEPLNFTLEVKDPMRSKINFLVFCLYSLLFLSCEVVAAEPERNPILEAINLVADTQYAEIKLIDKSDWWFDTKRRDWSVQRTFEPGVIDSTHLFEVTYKIDGKEVITWQVDLRNKKVEKIGSITK